MTMIYLDNAATTKMRPAVVEAMAKYMNDSYGNPGSLYRIGREARVAIETAREQVAKLIDATPEQIVFTSGGSEGNSMVFRMVEANSSAYTNKLVAISEIEHDSVIKAAENLLDNYGYSVEHIPVLSNVGHVLPVTLMRAMLSDPCLVSVMCANNEIGVFNDVKTAANIVHQNGALFHTDCVQALGSTKISMKDIDCDFATFSAHKIHGPKGVGAIYIKNREMFSPMIFGGSNQELGMRGGTENVAGIVGFGEACKVFDHIDMTDIQHHYERLKRVFSQTICEKLDDYGICSILRLNGASDYGSKVLNFNVQGVDAESLILMADSAGVCISAGSACNSHDQIPSHVLKAIGLTDTEARQSFRVSFSALNSADEVAEAATIIARCIYLLHGDCE